MITIDLHQVQTSQRILALKDHFQSSPGSVVYYSSKKTGLPWHILAVKNAAYLLLTKIGSGSESTVWEASEWEAQKVVAISVSKRKAETSDAGDRLEKVLEKVRGAAHIAQVFATYRREPKKGFVKSFQVMDLYRSGDFLSLMSAPPPNLGNWKVDAAVQILQSIAELHEKQVVHRDIKPENFLVKIEQKRGVRHMNVHLSDFGLACESSDEENLKTALGSARYISPEVIRRWSHCVDNSRASQALTTQLDVWGAGMILHLLFIGEVPPWFDLLGEAVLRKTKEGVLASLDKVLELIEQYPKQFPNPSPMQSFILTMLDPNPETRYTAQAALEVFKQLSTSSNRVGRSYPNK